MESKNHAQVMIMDGKKKLQSAASIIHSSLKLPTAHISTALSLQE